MSNLTQPQYIRESGIAGNPIDYAWNKDISAAFFGEKDQNVRLYRAIDESNYRAKYALGVAISEWLIWRFEGLANLEDLLNRLEAAWANEIHPAYSKTLRFKLSEGRVFHHDPMIGGPLKLIANFLGDIRAHYYNGNIYIAEPIVKQAMLAKHLLPPNKGFAEWLQDRIRQLVQRFPRGAAYDKKEKTYDFSAEKPIPREFFDTGFEYSEAAAAECLQLFLDSLDRTNNPYLCSPEEMRERGFTGVPYKYS